MSAKKSRKARGSYDRDDAKRRHAHQNIRRSARYHVGFILITGQRDGNYTPMKTMFARGFKVDGFKARELLRFAGPGPSDRADGMLEKAIDALDALPKAREK